MSAAGKSMHPLDRPIWSALTTRQQALAEGGALALRYLSHANRALRGHGGYVGAELAALGVYRRQGMEIRRRFYLTVLHKRM